jgi:hypothetical protein
MKIKNGEKTMEEELLFDIEEETCHDTYLSGDRSLG